MINSNIHWVPGLTIEEMERQCILQAINFYRGNKTQTAQALGIAIRTLDNKLEKYEADAKTGKEFADKEQAKRNEILARMRGIPQQFDGNRDIIPGDSTRQIQNGVEVNAGIRMESTEDTATKHEVSVPKREEVQTVLPRRASGGSSKRAR